jgi:hypothetical protein
MQFTDSFLLVCSPDLAFLSLHSVQKHCLRESFSVYYENEFSFTLDLVDASFSLPYLDLISFG